MSNSKKIEQAKEFATKKFDEAGGKNHFLEVYDILKNEFQINDEGVLIAALLHDTLEDTETTYEEIKNTFSQDIADLVDEVSHPKNYSGSQVTDYYEKLKHISSRAKMIKLADFLSHLKRLIGVYKKRKEVDSVVHGHHGRYIKQIIAVAETCPESEAKSMVIKFANEFGEVHIQSKVRESNK